MSNSIAPGSSADVNVKVTALTTNPNVPVTYKTIILKKNLVNGVNTLTQEMISATNTKYVIKYDYVLGEDITVPENCILEFDGGSINGVSAYIITYTNTYIYNYKQGCYKNIECTGSISNNELYIDYYGSDDSIALNNLLLNCSGVATILINRDIVLTADIQSPVNTQTNNYITFLGIGDKAMFRMNDYKFYGKWDDNDGIFGGGLHFINIKFQGKGQTDTIHFDAGTLIRCTFDNCVFAEMDICFNASKLIQQLYISNCFVKFTKTFINAQSGMAAVTLCNTSIEASVNGIITTSCANLSVCNCCIEGLTGTAIKVLNSAKTLSIRDNYFELNQYNIDISDITLMNNIIIEGNGFHTGNITNAVIVLPTSLSDFKGCISTKNNSIIDGTAPMFGGTPHKDLRNLVEDINNVYTTAGMTFRDKDQPREGSTIYMTFNASGISCPIPMVTKNLSFTLSNITIPNIEVLDSSLFSIRVTPYYIIVSTTDATTISKIGNRLINAFLTASLAPLS